MKKLLSIVLTLALLCSLLPSAFAAGDGALTRGELAQLLVEVCGYQEELDGYAAQPSPFSDIPDESALAPAASLLSDKGLMRGDGSGAFRPDAPVSQLECAAALLRWAGLTDAQIGAWPGDYAVLSSGRALGLLDGSGDAGIDADGVRSMAETASGYRASITAETPAPLFVNGEAQPIFPYETVIREVVYVETPNDTDGDGKADLVQVLVQRPAATELGMKAASIYEARPYSAGTTDAYDLDTWNAQVVNAKLTQASASTTTTREDFAPKAEPQTADVAFGAPGTVGVAGDGGDVWQNTENVDAYDYWLVRGYAYVSCSGLGTLGSEGFETCGSYEETAAFAAVVDWLHGTPGVKAYSGADRETEVKADWSNGNVAMSGQSYAGTTAFAVAATGVEGLKTIVPRAGIASWYDYYRSQGTAAGGLYYPGDDCHILADYCMSRRLDEADYGPIQAGYEAFLAAMIESEDALSGDYNEFWYERDYAANSDQLACSALIIHGLNDFNVRPKQFDSMFKAFETAGQDVKLLLHQGAHYTPTEIVDLDLNGILGRWYAHYLYGVDNGAEKDPAVRVQSNLDLTWSTYDAWDTAEKSLKLEAGEGERTFTSDLSVTSFDPTLADTEDNGWMEYCTDTVYAWEREMLAGDTGASAVYRFDVAEDAHISGTATVTVKASADRPTGILSAMLVDFAPEGGMDAVMLEQYGESVPTETAAEGGLWLGGGLPAQDLLQFSTTHTDAKIVTRGWMDIQNRTSIYNVDVVEPGESYTFTLELQPIDYVVKAGHQLGLVLYSVDPEVTYWPADVTNFTVDNAGTFVEIPVL